MTSTQQVRHSTIDSTVGPLDWPMTIFWVIVVCVVVRLVVVSRRKGRERDRDAVPSQDIHA